MPNTTLDQVRFAAPTLRERHALRQMARQSFAATFGHDWAPEPFAEFLEASYGAGGTMDRDLADPRVSWLAAFDRGQPIGFVKVTPLRAAAPAPLPRAVEMQQIYVLDPWHGSGVADRLIRWALTVARSRGAPEVYLTVFDHNERAKGFYRRHGFADVGRCAFVLGGVEVDDRVWRRTL